MKRRISLLGSCGVLLCCGLFLVAASVTNSDGRMVGSERLSKAGGGACYFCDILTGQCGTTGQTLCYIAGEGANAGKRMKGVYTGQDEAICATKEGGGKATCATNTPMLCTTRYICTGVDANGNCTGCGTGTTTDVPTNCTMSGVCDS